MTFLSRKFLAQKPVVPVQPGNPIDRRTRTFGLMPLLSLRVLSITLPPATPTYVSDGTLTVAKVYVSLCVHHLTRRASILINHGRILVLKTQLAGTAWRPLEQTIFNIAHFGHFRPTGLKLEAPTERIEYECLWDVRRSEPYAHQFGNVFR